MEVERNPLLHYTREEEIEITFFLILRSSRPFDRKWSLFLARSHERRERRLLAVFLARAGGRSSERVSERRLLFVTDNKQLFSRYVAVIQSMGKVKEAKSERHANMCTCTNEVISIYNFSCLFLPPVDRRRRPNWVACVRINTASALSSRLSGTCTKRVPIDYCFPMI